MKHMLSFLVVVVSLLFVEHCMADPASYCQDLKATCPTQFEIDFNDDDLCLSFAALWDDGIGGPEDTNNTIGCREYHISVANNDDSIHCVHAGLNGGNICGSYCDNYCFTRTISEPGCEENIPEFDCQRRCAEFPNNDQDGTDPSEMRGITGGNNVQCRIYHAAAAFLTENDVHCFHSSLQGGNLCGNYCENYCYYFENSCPEEVQYTDNDECERACGAMNVDSDDAVSGPSVNCRLYHIDVAVSGGLEDIHCPHARFRSFQGACGDECDHLCEVNLNFCDGDADGGYSTVDRCLSICRALPLGTVNDTVGNTVGCRNYHVDFAVQQGNAQAEAHCQHSGMAGSEQCGDWCDAYCALSSEVCGANYENDASCLQSCEDMEGSDIGAPFAYSAASADTIQCRLYHVGVASESDDNAEIHCPHASVNGGGVCVAQPTITSEGDSNEPAETTGGGEPSTEEVEPTDNGQILLTFIATFAVILL